LGVDPAHYESARTASDSASSLLVVGALADVVEDQFARLFATMGIAPVRFLPPRRSTELPPIGPGTQYLLAQPFLADTARALEERGAVRIPAPFPLGVEGTTLWVQAAADAFGVDPGRVRAAIELPRERGKRGVARYRERLEGKRVFLFPDSQLEIPIARFLARELSMRVIEAGMPYLHRRHLAEELVLLPDDVALSEGQDVERQLDRCHAASPDLVVCGLGLANPLEAQRLATKWSIELLFTPVQGYDQAGDLAELFARPLARRSMLAV
jgi:light-independent protochlorophyllide reductase subunit N